MAQMPPEWLTKLMKEVFEQGLTFGLWVAIFGGLVAAGLGAFVGAYLKKVGELRAHNEQFDRLTDQLKAQTRATEGIRTDFAKELADFTESARAENSRVLELLKNQLSRQSGDRTRCIEIQLRYRSRQIEELYGPLASLIEQIRNVWRVRRSILAVTDTRDEQTRIRQFLWERYFTPLHQEIAGVLKTKLYLLEGGSLPESFRQYLEHATVESCQQHLRRELQIDISRAGYQRWPKRFRADVQGMLAKLTAEHQSGLAELGVVDPKQRGLHYYDVSSQERETEEAEEEEEEEAEEKEKTSRT
jgi:hypothetical protein